MKRPCAWCSNGEHPNCVDVGYFAPDGLSDPPLCGCPCEGSGLSPDEYVAEQQRIAAEEAEVDSLHDAVDSGRYA